MSTKIKRRGRRDLELDLFARARHARFLERGTVYHVLSRVVGNMFLLRPDLAGELRRVIAGVLAQAKVRYPTIALYAAVVLSNHLHMLLEILNGDPRVAADFIGFFKREVSRRWRHHANWTRGMWEGYQATAVITPEAQLIALRYLLQQGVKEDLVEDPRHWPGFHCAESLATGLPTKGYWFDGTAYGKAKHAEAAKKEPKEVHRSDFKRPRELHFDKLPALSHLSDAAYREHMARWVDEIVEEGKRRRGDRPVMGVERICSVNTRDSSDVPDPPWFEQRRRMVVWDNPKAPEVKAYLDRYWDFQRAFRIASRSWRRKGPVALPLFPERAFVPGLRRRPTAHAQQAPP